MDEDNRFEAEGKWQDAPVIRFNGLLEFNTYWFGHPGENYGSASAFLPE